MKNRPTEADLRRWFRARNMSDGNAFARVQDLLSLYNLQADNVGVGINHKYVGRRTPQYQPHVINVYHEEILSGNEVFHTLHEFAHYLVAPKTRRERSNYGLGSPLDYSKVRPIVSGDFALAEEITACHLHVLLTAVVRGNWKFASLELMHYNSHTRGITEAYLTPFEMGINRPFENGKHIRFARPALLLDLEVWSREPNLYQCLERIFNLPRGTNHKLPVRPKRRRKII